MKPGRWIRIKIMMMMMMVVVEGVVVRVCYLANILFLSQRKLEVSVLDLKDLYPQWTTQFAYWLHPF
jgi:hypothetical protein